MRSSRAQNNRHCLSSYSQQLSGIANNAICSNQQKRESSQWFPTTTTSSESEKSIAGYISTGLQSAYNSMARIANHSL